MDQSIAKPESSSGANSPAHQTAEVTTVGNTDVLLGRGAIKHGGNIRFRELVTERRAEYLSASKRQHKDKIASQVISAITENGGRFLKKIETATGRTTWQIADEESVMHKVKQALRELGPAPTNPDAVSSPPPTKKRLVQPPLEGPNAADNSVTIDSRGRANANASVPSLPSAESTTPLGAGALSDATATSQYLPHLFGTGHQQLNQWILNALTSLSHSTNQAPSTLRPPPQSYSVAPSASVPAHQVPTSDRIINSDLSTGVGVPAPLSTGHTSMDNPRMLALLAQQEQPALAASLASSILNQQGQHGVFQSAQQGTELAALAACRASATRDLSLLSVNDQLQALYDALQGRNMAAQSMLRTTTPATGQERTSPDRYLLENVREKGKALHLHALQHHPVAPSFLPVDLKAETTGIATLIDSMDLDRKSEDSSYLAFSFTEVLILYVLCSFGMPTWSPSKLDRGEVFAPIQTSRAEPSISYHISWHDFGLLLQAAGTHWEDRVAVQVDRPGSMASLASRAVDISTLYSSDCRQLAKTALCIVEKIRGFLKTSPSGDTAPKSLSSWIEKEIKHWASTLECDGANGFPIAYTASDFLLSFPEHKENSAFKLVSFCGSDACQTMWNQIVSLSRARSIAIASPTADGLATRLERIFLNEGVPSWKGMPDCWSMNILFYDVELLKAVLLHGYMGVLNAQLSAPLSAALYTHSIAQSSFLELGVESKSLVQERFEQLAGLLAEKEEDVAPLLDEPRRRKCLDARIEAFRKLS